MTHHKEILGFGTKLRQSGSQVSDDGIEVLVCNVQASVRRLDIILVLVGVNLERFCSVFIIDRTLIILGQLKWNVLLLSADKCSHLHALATVLHRASESVTECVVM